MILEARSFSYYHQGWCDMTIIWVQKQCCIIYLCLVLRADFANEVYIIHSPLTYSVEYYINHVNVSTLKFAFAVPFPIYSNLVLFHDSGLVI